MVIILESISLYKTYGGGRWALEDFNINLRRGEIVALLGRNGAGKTTFIRIASTQLKQTRGEVRVFGYDVTREAKKIRERIAVMPQEGRPESLNTAWEHVYLYLAARGLSLSEAKRRAERYLRELDLWDCRDEVSSKLSGGLRQRILVAMAAATEAELLFLDEPTIGLDPISRIRTWRAIKRAVSGGASVFLTTHDMNEAEMLADRVAIIDEGRLILFGSIKEVKSSLPYPFRVDVPASFPISELEGHPRILNLASRTRVYTSEAGAREIVDAALRRGVEVSVSPITLEDVFISFVGALLDEA